MEREIPEGDTSEGLRKDGMERGMIMVWKLGGQCFQVLKTKMTKLLGRTIQSIQK